MYPNTQIIVDYLLMTLIIDYLSDFIFDNDKFT